MLGVKENTKTHELFVIGLKDAQKMLDDFVNAANSTDKLSHPIFSDENLRIETIRGREVVVIEVPRVKRRLRPIYEGRDPFKGTRCRTPISNRAGVSCSDGLSKAWSSSIRAASA